MSARGDECSRARGDECTGARAYHGLSDRIESRDWEILVLMVFFCIPASMIGPVINPILGAMAGRLDFSVIGHLLNLMYKHHGIAADYDKGHPQGEAPGPAQAFSRCSESFTNISAQPWAAIWRSAIDRGTPKRTVTLDIPAIPGCSSNVTSTTISEGHAGSIP